MFIQDTLRCSICDKNLEIYGYHDFEDGDQHKNVKEIMANREKIICTSFRWLFTIANINHCFEECPITLFLAENILTDDRPTNFPRDISQLVLNYLRQTNCKYIVHLFSLDNNSNEYFVMVVELESKMWRYENIERKLIESIFSKDEIRIYKE